VSSTIPSATVSTFSLIFFPIACNSRILSDIRKYIKLRQDLAGQSVPASSSEKTNEQPDEQPGEQPPLDSTTAQPTSQPNGQPNGRTNDALLTPSRRLRSGDTQQPVRTRTSTPMSLPPSERPKLPTTTRDLLTQVACMTEDFLRASQEKVNLAQANYDSVSSVLESYGCKLTHPLFSYLGGTAYPHPRPSYQGTRSITFCRSF